MPKKRPTTVLSSTVRGSTVRNVFAGICAIALALAGAAAVPSAANAKTPAAKTEQNFGYLAANNLGKTPDSPENAIDSAFSADGKTLVSIDSSGVVFSDLSNSGKPHEVAQAKVSRPVAVTVAGSNVLIATHDSLVVFDLSSQIRIGTIPMPHVPTDVAASPQGDEAAVSLADGELVLFNSLAGAPDQWPQVHSVIQLDQRSKVANRTQPRPDQLAYSPNGKAIAVSLPYNNGVTIVKADDGGRIRAISAGKANVIGVDTKNDGSVNLTDNLYSQQRQPTGIAWIDSRHLASSSPGTRSWSIYNTSAGKLTWDSGTGFEYEAVENGVYSDASSDRGGSSPDTVTVGRFDGKPYVFIGAKYANFTAVYTVNNAGVPSYRQMLPTPPRAPIAVHGTTLVAGGTSVFGLTTGPAAFPALQSDWFQNRPLGWDGTTGLSADQFHAEQVYTLTGDPTQILGINTSIAPAKIDSAIPLTLHRKPYDVHASGIYQRSDGRFLIAATGSGTDNQLLLADQNGNISGTIKLPTDVTNQVTADGGLGGVSGFTVNGTEYIWVVFKQPLKRDDGLFRIGRYDPDNKSWTWYGYRPVSTAASVELGDIAVIDQRRVALIEQDLGAKGTTIGQHLTTFSIPGRGAAAHDGLADTVQGKPASDLIDGITRPGNPLPTSIRGLVTAGNDHAFVLADSTRDTAAGSQPELVDLGAATTAYPEHTTALGTTLASWLLPLIGVIMVWIGCFVAAGIAIWSRLHKRPLTPDVTT